MWLRRPLGTAIEMLAAIPSIIYGMWGLFVFAPLFQEHVQPFFIATLGKVPGVGFLFEGPPMGIGMMTAGIILAVMVIPFITAVMRDVFELVPPMLKESAYGLGSTTWEVTWRVVLPYTKVGVIGGIMLGLGRALGETMAITFVIGNAHRLSPSLFAPGNSIEVMGRRYELAQFHFHRPSEERIDGRQFDMVVHLVHKDPEGRLAVVAVLLERGSAQPVVQKVWNNLPLEKGEEVPARDTLDLAALLPAERSYFTYMGSLTTPPCSEGVLWMVMKQPVTISPEQIGIFARLYPMNARPIQSAAGRLIKESN